MVALQRRSPHSQVRSTPSSLLSLRPALSLWFRAVSRALKLKVLLSKWVSLGSTSVELADSGVREKWARKKNCPTRYQSVPPARSSKGTQADKPGRASGCGAIGLHSKKTAALRRFLMELAGLE